MNTTPTKNLATIEQKIIEWVNHATTAMTLIHDNYDLYTNNNPHENDITRKLNLTCKVHAQVEKAKELAESLKHHTIREEVRCFAEHAITNPKILHAVTQLAKLHYPN